MDFITFISNQDFLFWIFIPITWVLVYLLSALKIILIDVKETKLTYGRYCSNLKPLYKPYKQCFKEAFVLEWKSMVIFTVIYITFFYYKYS